MLKDSEQHLGVKITLEHRARNFNDAEFTRVLCRKQESRDPCKQHEKITHSSSHVKFAKERPLHSRNVKLNELALREFAPRSPVFRPGTRNSALIRTFAAGEYVIDVFYYGKPIQGSPFRVNAFDWNRITVHNLKSSGLVGRMVEFDSE